MSFYKKSQLTENMRTLPRLTNTAISLENILAMRKAPTLCDWHLFLVVESQSNLVWVLKPGLNGPQG